MKQKTTKAEAEEFDRVFAPPTEDEFYNSLSKAIKERRKTIKPEKVTWKMSQIEGCSYFEKFNEDWCINSDGDMLGWGYYLISSNRLKEDDWLIHMMSKRQFDANTFIPAYIEACKIAGIKEVTMKMFY